MPRSRNTRRAPRAPQTRRRWDWRRVAGGLAELFRNFALIAFSTPFIEPLVTGQPPDGATAPLALLWGFLFLAVSLIFDHERRD